MKVGDWMSRDVVTVSPKEGVRVAEHLMKAKRVRHLPVVSGGKLVGIITDRDICRALPLPATSLEAQEISCLLDTLQVQAVMTRKVISVTPETSIEAAAALLLAHKIVGLPVVDGERLVGILTEGDVLRASLEGGREEAQEVGKCWLSDAMSGFRVSGSL
jgi:acetoin utilization protein AcuB